MFGLGETDFRATATHFVKFLGFRMIATWQVPLGKCQLALVNWHLPVGNCQLPIDAGKLVTLDSGGAIHWFLIAQTKNMLPYVRRGWKISVGKVPNGGLIIKRPGIMFVPQTCCAFRVSYVVEKREFRSRWRRKNLHYLVSGPPVWRVGEPVAEKSSLS